MRWVLQVVWIFLAVVFINVGIYVGMLAFDALSYESYKMPEPVCHMLTLLKKWYSIGEWVLYPYFKFRHTILFRLNWFLGWFAIFLVETLLVTSVCVLATKAASKLGFSAEK